MIKVMQARDTERLRISQAATPLMATTERESGGVR